MRLSRKRVVCAAAAAFFTVVSFSVFVSTEPGDSGRPRPVVAGTLEVDGGAHVPAEVQATVVTVATRLPG